MSANDVRCLKRYFDLKSSHISDYWLKCCLEWFKEEYNTYTEDFMCSSVYQQWLDADLRDIEVQSLPSNLTEQKKIILNGKYAVQVMYVKDISKPAYSQLKNMRDLYKLTRSHIDNENESAETPGKRVLYLYMTDGIQNICGFEYHTVSCLHLYMTPGIKILLIGPLIVRNGEFMFKENNVQIIGGEVEELKVVNAAENVLARELNMPENPNPRTSEINPANSTQTSTYTPHTTNINNQTNINGIVNYTNTKNNVNSNINNIMSEFEDDHFLANFDTSTFEEQEAAYQAQIHYEDADLNLDDDLFENLDFYEQLNEETTSPQNLMNTVNDAAFIDGVNVEELERQEFERRLQEEEEDLDYHLEDDIDIVSKVIEEKIKPQQIIVPIINNPEPFIYIKHLLDNSNKLASNKTYRVKARFVNNIEKIKLNKNKGWTMKFEIKDPSGKLVVDFLSDVVENLMELSPAEALAENRSVKNKECKSHEKLSEALAKCKQKLDSIEYIMDLQFNEEKTMPTIVNLESVKKEHLEQLEKRVKSVSILLL